MAKTYSEHTPPQLPVTVKWYAYGKDWTSEIETPTEWFNFVWEWNREQIPFTVEETA